MKVKMYLHGQGLSLGVARIDSSVVFRVLADAGVEVEEVTWDGRHESLPDNPPGLVRASTRFGEEEMVRLAKFCAFRRHFVFYQNSFVSLEGKIELGEDFLEAWLRDWLSHLAD